MDFYESVTNALYCRMEEGALSVPLEESEPYAEGLATLQDALAVVQDEEARARAILEDREANGPYRYPEDLIRVRGIGETVLSNILDQITAGSDGNAENIGG